MTLDLVLAGFGSVARRFVSLIGERVTALHDGHGLRLRIVGIATHRHGCVVNPAGLDGPAALAAYASAAGLGSLAGAATGAETAGGVEDAIARVAAACGPHPVVLLETTTLDVREGEPATSYIRAALRAGMHVVTANKGPVACHYRALREEAARHGVAFLCEGTVLDGIPVFNLVRETLPAVRVTGFRGVVNTTANFILSEMEDGLPFAEALAKMQAAGIAEADASLDVDGWDAAAKAAALANVLMDADLTPAAVDRVGITGVTAADLAGARAGGRRVKLVSSAWRDEGGVHARVAPEAEPADGVLGQLRGVDNAITLHTDPLGDITVVEHGGHLTHTAYALVTDLVAVRRQLRGRPAAPLRRDL
jgi:homoserine dehydrogenase